MKKLILFFCGLTLFGCASMRPSEYQVYVDSIAVSNVNFGKKYVLLPANKDINIRDMQFREYASYVHKVLINQGYEPAKNFDSADILIMLSYGIGEPKEHNYTYSSPVFGQTGVSSSQTTGMVSSYGNFATYSGYTTKTPTYGITGYRQHSGSYSTCDRFIMLSAFNLKTKGKNISDLEVWKTIITSKGSSCDLRFVFPGILLATEGLIGTNTGSKVGVSILVNDPAISELRSSPPIDFDVQLPEEKNENYLVGENRKIYLLDDTVVYGEILSDKNGIIEVKTKYGKVSVPKKDIKE